MKTIQLSTQEIQMLLSVLNAVNGVENIRAILPLYDKLKSNLEEDSSKPKVK